MLLGVGKFGAKWVGKFERNIQLSQETIKMLREANFNDHITSLTARSHDQPWDARFVRSRSERIIEILWKRVSVWLFK